MEGQKRGIPLTPSNIIHSSTDENTAKCKTDPGMCLWQCVIDATIFATLFSAASLVIDHRKPDLDSIFVFLSLWIPVLYLLKSMDLEYSDQLARVAGWSLAQKMFSALSN